MLARRASKSAFERLEIRQVLSPAGCAFVANEVLPREGRHVLIDESSHESRFPGFLELDSGYRCDHIDSYGRNSNLEDEVRLAEFLDLQILRWGPEGSERLEGAPSILGIGPNPDIEIASGSDMPVDRESVSTDHQVFNAECVEFGK